MTNALKLINHKGLFQLLGELGCLPWLLSVISCFHAGMRRIVMLVGSFFTLFFIGSSVNYGILLFPHSLAYSSHYCYHTHFAHHTTEPSMYVQVAGHSTLHFSYLRPRFVNWHCERFYLLTMHQLPQPQWQPNKDLLTAWLTLPKRVCLTISHILGQDVCDYPGILLLDLSFLVTVIIPDSTIEQIASLRITSLLISN